MSNVVHTSLLPETTASGDGRADRHYGMSWRGRQEFVEGEAEGVSEYIRRRLRGYEIKIMWERKNQIDRGAAR